MTDFENENIEEQVLWSPSDEKDNQKWMKKSKVKIGVFLVFTFLILLFFILFLQTRFVHLQFIQPNGRHACIHDGL